MPNWRSVALVLLHALSPTQCQTFVDWVREGSSCSAHCESLGSSVKCLAACGADGLCSCDEEHPWAIARCPSVDEANPQLCTCADGVTDGATEVRARQATFSTSAPRERLYADAYVQRAREASEDRLCGADGEVDGLTATQNLHVLGEAVQRMRRCGMVVIRNALSANFVHAFRRPFGDYVHGLSNGTISIDGRSSLNEPYFLHKLDDKRWEVLLPRSFAVPELFNSVILRSVLSHFSVLGRDYVLHSLGAALSEPGSKRLHWHRYSRYPMKDAGVAGADVPPHAVTVLIPLLDVTLAHGPTEFCVGSSHLVGFDQNNYKLRDPTLAAYMDDAKCPDGLRLYKPELKVRCSCVGLAPTRQPPCTHLVPDERPHSASTLADG